MNSFISFVHLLSPFLEIVLDSPRTHGKWLNTLSYLENCGARQIAKCEHPLLVKKQMLKHAAEEFRHALHLKRQIEKLEVPFLEDYRLSSLLGEMVTFHYLKTLDLSICRFLKNEKLSPSNIREGAYLLTTYSIEKRAQELYPLYEKHLKASGSKVTVRSILLEEKTHLEEMENALDKFPNGFAYASSACQIEGAICSRWIESLIRSIK